MPTALDQAVNWNALQANVLRFNAFDWLLVIVVLLSALAAFRRGIIRVLFSLAGLTCGIVFASWNYLRLAGSLHRWVTSFAIAQVVAFVLLVVVVTVLFSVVASLIQRAVSAVGLGLVDRLLGACFGVVRGVLFGVALMMAAIAFLPSASWLLESRLAPYFLEGAHAVSFVVPEHFQRQISSGATHLIQQSPELFHAPSSKHSMTHQTPVAAPPEAALGGQP